MRCVLCVCMCGGSGGSVWHAEERALSVGLQAARELTMSGVSLLKQAEEKPVEKDAFDLKLVSFDDKSKIKVSISRKHAL